MFIALVDWDKCTGCGDCVKSCPNTCFIMSPEGKSDAYRSSHCIDCGSCKEACRENAIIISIGWGGKTYR